MLEPDPHAAAEVVPAALAMHMAVVHVPFLAHAKMAAMGRVRVPLVDHNRRAVATRGPWQAVVRRTANRLAEIRFSRMESGLDGMWLAAINRAAEPGLAPEPTWHGLEGGLAQHGCNVRTSSYCPLRLR